MPALDGITRCDELLVDADINGRANIYAFTAGLQAMRGQFVEARDLLDEARSTFRDLGQAGVTMCARIGAEIEVLAGNDQAAEDALRSSCAILERAEDYSYLATHAVGLAAVLYRLGRYTEADAFLQVSKRHMIAGDLHSRIPCSGVEAKLLARRRRFAEGEALARQGVTAASSTDALNLSAHASLDLGEVLILAGDAVAGQEAVAQAVELFGKKGNTVGAGRAQELLVDLSTA
jgi:ATP/maltotriose-dependent transcriptional regulator MalT